MVRHRPARKQVEVIDENRVYPARKANYRVRANKYFDEYNKILVVLVDNVQSRQMQNVRIQLRGKAVVLMGKNTTMKKVLLDRANSGEARDQLLYDSITPLLKDNVGLVFTNDDVDVIKGVIDDNLVTAAARQGTVAPCDVFIPCGNTGMDPQKTQFFQALNIVTKITKGTVEILKEEQVVTMGEKVKASEAALLQLLGIKPFHYGLVIQWVYDNGSVYSKKMMDMSDDDMKAMFLNGITQATALSLATGFTNTLSMPHVFKNAFKNVLAHSVASEYSFTACNGEELKEAVISGKGLGGGGGAAAPAAAAPAAAAVAAPVEEEEEEDDDMGFDLFD